MPTSKTRYDLHRNTQFLTLRFPFTLVAFLHFYLRTFSEHICKKPFNSCLCVCVCVCACVCVVVCVCVCVCVCGVCVCVCCVCVCVCVYVEGEQRIDSN